MTSLFTLFSNNILPIFLTAGAGYLLARFIQLEARTLSRVIFYVFSPCLVFTLLTTNQLSSQDSLLLVAYAISFSLAIGAITYIIARLLKLERRMIAAVLITVMFTNAGNYGLSLNSFAFGENALAYASLYFVMSSMMINTFGVLIASMGKTDFKRALVGLLRFPTLYAVILALIVNKLSINIPLPLDRSIDLLGQAAVPSMLVMLGLQLSRATLAGRKLPIAFASGLRLLAAPLIAILFSNFFGFSGPIAQAAVSEASMPSAVMTIILATEFDVHPAFVTTVVTTTTLFSPIVLTPLLAYLGG